MNYKYNLTNAMEVLRRIVAAGPEGIYADNEKGIFLSSLEKRELITWDREENRVRATREGVSVVTKAIHSKDRMVNPNHA